MATFEFGHNENNVREFYPTYGGVDWQEAWEHRHNNDISFPAWGQTIDELGEFCEQLHQENCCFYINDTDPSFDVVVVLDHRDDGGDWWLTREQVGTDHFDTLVRGIGNEVMVVTTKYPLKHIAEFVIQTMFNDL